MANGVYIPMSASMAAWRQLEVTSNNLANVNTPGYKQLRTTFDAYLVDTNDGRTAEKGFTAMTSTAIDGTSGQVQQTGNPLDVAIDGEGFFLVGDRQNPMLTRAGSFRVAVDGTLVDPTGQPVLSGNLKDGLGTVQLRADGGPVTISSEGEVAQDGTTLATLTVVTAPTNRLEPAGGANYRTDLRTATQVDRPELLTGSIESSNVNPIRGMIDLIQVTQDYARSEKIIQQYRQLDGRAVDLAR